MVCYSPQGVSLSTLLNGRSVQRLHLLNGITTIHDPPKLYLGKTRDVDLLPDPLPLADPAAITSNNHIEYGRGMSLDSPLYLASFVLSLTASLLLLLLPPYLLPPRFTGIPQSQRPRPSAISLIFCTILLAGHFAATSLMGRRTLVDGSTVCAVDAILQTFLITAVLAHLPLIASVSLCLRPTRHEDIRTLSRFVWIIALSSPYIYSILPNIPLLTMLASGNESFGVWWDLYCTEKDAWWRIVHGVSLALPPVVTLVLCIMIADVLGSCSGDPSPKVRVKSMEWIQLVFLITCALGAIAYLVMEQIIGWSAAWIPRIAEAAAAPAVLSAFIIDPNVWRAYSFWAKGCRPPRQEELTDLFEPISGTGRQASPSDWLANKEEKRARSFHSSQSSFYVPPPAPSWRPYGRKLSRSRPKGASPARTRSDRSKHQVTRTISTRSETRSPPFTYSVSRSDTSPTFAEPDEVDMKQFLAPPSPSYYIPSRPLQRPVPAATRLAPATDPIVAPEVLRWITPPSPSYYLPRPPSPRAFNGLSRPADLRNQLAANLQPVQTENADGSLLHNPFSPKPSDLAYLTDGSKAGVSEVATNVSDPSRYSKESLYDPSRSEGITTRQPIPSLSGSVFFVGFNARLGK